MEQNSKPRLFIQFAGQGVKYIDELRRLYMAQPKIQAFIQDAIEVIKKEAASYDDSETCFFSQGLDADVWINQPEKTPDAGYLSSSPLSHPFIFLNQICNYISVLQEGVDPRVLIQSTHSVTGFSTGVVAAILVSMDLDIDKLCEMALKVQAMFFWQGVRCQQSMFRFGSRPELESTTVNSSKASPSCMASVNQIPLDELKELIREYADYGVVHPAYELLPERWIVAGLPENLVGFKSFLQTKGKGAEWKFIPSTIAAHCPFLLYALETSPLDAKNAGLQISGSDLKIPVWANDMGKDLRESQDVIQDVMTAYFTKPAVWRKQINPLLNGNEISYVLDFGPGAGVASLTENLLKEKDTKVIRCTVPLGRKRLFKEVMPLIS
jgi:malonyl CoA-acyl carrier protein transacylase